MKSMDLARRRLQELSAASSEIDRDRPRGALVAEPGRPLRRRPQLRPRALLPLVEELFVQAALALLRRGRLRRQGGQAHDVSRDR